MRRTAGTIRTATGTLATLPECTLAELDVLRYVDVIFADEATRAGLTADIVRLVSGPTPQSQVLTSFEPGIEKVLIGCPRIAEGQSTGPVYAAYTGVWNTTGGEYNVGLQVQATIRASVQSSIVAQAMAQKALAHATCPKEYRTPTENAIIVMGPHGACDVGAMFATSYMQDLAKLTTAQCTARWPASESRVSMARSRGLTSSDPRSDEAAARLLDALHITPGTLRLEVGAAVKLVGLSDRPELNGRLAKITHVFGSDRRSKIGILVPNVKDELFNDDVKGETTRVRVANVAAIEEEDIRPSHLCVVCGEEAHQRCECKLPGTWVCSKQCQKASWKNHKHVCPLRRPRSGSAK